MNKLGNILVGVTPDQDAELDQLSKELLITKFDANYGDVPLVDVESKPDTKPSPSLVEFTQLQNVEEENTIWLDGWLLIAVTVSLIIMVISLII